MKKWLVTVGVVLALAGCGGGETEEPAEGTEQPEAGVSAEPLEVAVIPSQTVGEMQTGLDLLEERLAEGLGREVKVESYPNYNAVVEALNFNHIDLAFLGPLTYVIAHEQSGAKAIVTQEVEGSPYYYSYIITHADAQWESLDELLEDAAEVDLAFASISSTSGHLMPGLELRQRGYYESEDQHQFNQVQFAGSHDIVASLVQERTVDAGAIDSAILEALMKEADANGGSLRDDVKIIWQSEQLYQYPWVVPSEMDDETIAAIQEAFYQIDDPEILQIFGGASAFVEADHSKYADVLEAAREFDMLTLE